jgi:hypothetical protein
MERLALSFPTLRRANGVSPWDPLALNDWAVGPVPSSGGRYAAQFVLSVFNPYPERTCGRFDLVRAVNAWDDYHVAALRAWLVNPWIA